MQCIYFQNQLSTAALTATECHLVYYLILLWESGEKGKTQALVISRIKTLEFELFLHVVLSVGPVPAMWSLCQWLLAVHVCLIFHVLCNAFVCFWISISMCSCHFKEDEIASAPACRGWIYSHFSVTPWCSDAPIFFLMHCLCECHCANLLWESGENENLRLLFFPRYREWKNLDLFQLFLCAALSLWPGSNMRLLMTTRKWVMIAIFF